MKDESLRNAVAQLISGFVLPVVIQAEQFVKLCKAVFGGIWTSVRKRPFLLMRQWEQVAWMGMPIVVVAGFCVGMVTWFQIRDILRTYGAESNLPALVAVSVIVQTGPILTGLICGARLGAGISAEVGTMMLTEEVDALSSLGVNVVEALITPRVVAAFFALPVLTIAMDFSAVGGAMAAELVWGDMEPGVFLSRSLDLMTLRRALPATLKTAVFGALTALVAGNIGLHCPREAEAVGKAALRGVVASIIVVLMSDVIMVPVIQWMTNLVFAIA